MTQSRTGRFEYILAEYLLAVEQGDDNAIQMFIALWWRWPFRFNRWISEHPEDIPERIISSVRMAGIKIPAFQVRHTVHHTHRPRRQIARRPANRKEVKTR